MDKQLDLSSLDGRQLDPELFRRVWSRVVPEGQPSPIVVEPPEPASSPAPRPSPHPVSSAPRPSPQPVSPAPKLSPQPVSPEPKFSPQPVSPEPKSSPQPVSPAPKSSQQPVSPAPRSSQQPIFPAPKPSQRPVSRPVPTTPPPSQPLFCLGEQSHADAEQIKVLMDQALANQSAAQVLAQRGRNRTLNSLAADHRRALRQLSAAYFLITGQRYRPAPPPPVRFPSLPLALRDQFVREQHWERDCRQAMPSTGDPCLRELYQELAQDGVLHTGLIRSLLEQM